VYFLYEDINSTYSNISYFALYLIFGYDSYVLQKENKYFPPESSLKILLSQNGIGPNHSKCLQQKYFQIKIQMSHSGIRTPETCKSREEWYRAPESFPWRNNIPL